MNYTNYVAYFNGNGRCKVGITGNFQKRKRYYIQEATRHGIGPVSFRVVRTEHLGIARMVENDLCQSLRSHAIPGHREWFVADYETFLELESATRRIHKSFVDIFSSNGVTL